MMLMLGHALDRLIPAMVCHTSMKVTSDPRAVYTSENSRPMYPEPMMAIQSGTPLKLQCMVTCEHLQMRTQSVSPGGLAAGFPRAIAWGSTFPHDALPHSTASACYAPTPPKLMRDHSKDMQRQRTVLPSMGMPGGTNGTEPVAMMMSRAVTVPPTSTRPACQLPRHAKCLAFC